MLSLLWAWSHTVFSFNPGSFLGGYRDLTFPPVSWVVTIAIPSSAVILTLLDIYSLSGYPSPHQNVSSRRAGTLPGSLMNLQHQESAWEDFLVVPWWIHLPTFRRKVPSYKDYLQRSREQLEELKFLHGWAGGDKVIICIWMKILPSFRYRSQWGLGIQAL